MKAFFDVRKLRGAFVGVAWSAVLLSAGARPPVTATAAELPYLHVVYNVGSNAPVRVYGGKVALDLTTKKRWRQVLGELKELGVNVTTPLTSYGPHTIYPTRLPELTQCPGWASRHLDGLRMLLDTCREVGIDCYPAVWLYKAATPELCEKATRELFSLYGSDPAFTGFVPPVEANPQFGMESQDFIRLARLAKRLKPGVVVMDYPNGPFSFQIMQTIMARSLSGAVDVENVQFHPSDQRWQGDFRYARGLFHLVHGLCPGVRWIVHTHYKYGGGKRWIELDDLYRVTQAATLTASPYGTSIFSFLHAMWGNASSYNLDDPLERRLAWYKGILNAQRLLPYYHDAEPANAVAVMIPRYLRESSDSLLRRTYLPLANHGVGCHFFVNEENLGPDVEAIVAEQLSECSPRQIELLQRFVDAGGALLVLAPTRPALPANLSERAKRILGLKAVRRWQRPDVDRAFAAALQLDLDTGNVNVTKREERRYGRGRITLLPIADGAPLDTFLPEWAAVNASGRTVVEPALADFTFDTWSRRTTRGVLRMVIFLGTRKGAHAANVTVTMTTSPADATRLPRVWLLQPDHDTLQLPCSRRDGRIQVIVPKLTDEYNVLLFAADAPPALTPVTRLIRLHAPAPRLEVQFRLVNLSSRSITGVVHVIPPEEWRAHGGPLAQEKCEITLPPGGVATRGVTFPLPRSLVRKPYFFRYEGFGVTQRTIVFPEYGARQTFTDLTPTEIAAFTKPLSAAKKPSPPPPLGSHWIGVTADDPHAADPAACRPGICFLPGREWDPPIEYRGKTARYGERLPHLGGPNFLVNEPPLGDLEIRLTYWSESGGTMNLYDGRQYHKIAVLPPTEKWSQLVVRVPHELLATPGIDRGNYPGTNILFDLNCAAVYVHRLEARAVKGDQGT